MAGNEFIPLHLQKKLINKDIYETVEKLSNKNIEYIGKPVQGGTRLVQNDASINLIYVNIQKLLRYIPNFDQTVFT